jgi:hypothetical protein
MSTLRKLYEIHNIAGWNVYVPNSEELPFDPVYYIPQENPETWLDDDYYYNRAMRVRDANLELKDIEIVNGLPMRSMDGFIYSLDTRHTLMMSVKTWKPETVFSDPESKEQVLDAWGPKNRKKIPLDFFLWEGAAEQTEDWIKNQPNVGQICFSSWGWDQTNIDFYVVRKRSKQTAGLQQISSHHVTDNGYSGFSLPSLTVAGMLLSNDRLADWLDKNVYVYSFYPNRKIYRNGGSTMIGTRSSGKNGRRGFHACRLWNGKSLYFTNYA